MVKKLEIWLFGAVMFSYFLIRAIRIESTSSFVKYYLTDLLFVPAMCLFALILIRTIKNDKSLTIPWWLVAIQTFAISLYFEWYLPKYYFGANQYTSDLYDVLMYGIGAVLFLIVQGSFLKPRSI